MAIQTYYAGLDCQDCTEGMKQIRGCYEEVPYTEFEFEGEVLKQCPLKLISPLSRLMLQFYSFMEDGFLPNRGSLLEQPYRYLMGVSIIKEELGRIREDERKNREKERAVRGSGAPPPKRRKK